MKIAELFSNLRSPTSNLEESYKDFGSIFVSKTLEFDDTASPHSARDQAKYIEQRFVKLQRYMERGDISYWIGRINGTSSLVEFEREVYKFRQALNGAAMEMEARTPQYSRVYDDAISMTIVQLENFVAARKLCSGMRICIKSKPSDFDSYYDEGDLFLVTFKSSPLKFVVQTNHMMEDEYAIWDSGNQEIDVGELVLRSVINYVASDHYFIDSKFPGLGRILDDISAFLAGDEF